MSNTNETIDAIATQKEKQRTFQSFTMLSYIGNAVWGILFLILFIGCIINGEAMLKDGEDTSRLTFYLIASAVILISCIFCIIGVMGMKRGRKKGFKNYAIGSVIWVLLLFYDSTFGRGTYGMLFPIIASVSIVFVIYYALRLPKLT